MKEVDRIRPNYHDFEVELEALQTPATEEKDRVEKHIGIKEEARVVQNRI